MLRLQNRVAFITGAASGIGAACALRFVEEGAIVVGFDINENPESDWTTAVARQPKCQLITGDVRDDHALGSAIRSTRERFGSVDVLVNSAGIAAVGPVHVMEVSEFDRVIDINLSDESSFVNGTSIVVDGGFMAGKRFGIGEMFGLE